MIFIKLYFIFFEMAICGVDKHSFAHTYPHLYPDLLGITRDTPAHLGLHTTYLSQLRTHLVNHGFIVRFTKNS